MSGARDTDGAMVDVMLAMSRPEVARRRAAGQAIASPIALRALLDTGAQCTCVDPQYVRALALPLSGVTLVNVPTMGGMTGATQYDAGLTIIHPSGDAALDFFLPEVALTELSLGQIGFQLLIGRDLLDKCLLVYDGPQGTFSLSY